MSKIKRAFTVEQETKRLRLMQSINEVSLSEAGVMDTIKKGVAAVADKASSWAKGGTARAPSATPAPAQAGADLRSGRNRRRTAGRRPSACGLQ